MSETTRPKRVVIVDADNPMEEIHGEFFWREDHDRLLAQVREEAYRRGWQDGVSATQAGQTTTVRIRRRWTMRGRLALLLILFVATAFVVTLVQGMRS